MAREQRVVTYKGNVQGVGFRYTTNRVAGGYDVTGYVRNQPDGTVEVLAEGDSGEIDAFLSELERRMGYHIRDRQQRSAPPSDRYGQFGVKF
ncbi:MAG: acylphosphatase [Planctomycetota bacterium]